MIGYRGPSFIYLFAPLFVYLPVCLVRLLTACCELGFFCCCSCGIGDFFFWSFFRFLSPVPSLSRPPTYSCEIILSSLEFSNTAGEGRGEAEEKHVLASWRRGPCSAAGSHCAKVPGPLGVVAGRARCRGKGGRSYWSGEGMQRSGLRGGEGAASFLTCPRSC